VTTERSALGGGSFGYAIPVENGSYSVRLRFAEICWAGGAPGVNKRVFDVLIEDTLVLDECDLDAAVGPLTVDIRSFSTTVTDGVLNISFPTATIDNPTIEAIEVIWLPPS
jgi:hypothetical protein